MFNDSPNHLKFSQTGNLKHGNLQVFNMTLIYQMGFTVGEVDQTYEKVEED